MRAFIVYTEQTFAFSVQHEPLICAGFTASSDCCVEFPLEVVCILQTQPFF